MISLDNGLLAYISYSLVIIIFKVYKFIFWGEEDIQNSILGDKEIPDLFTTFDFFNPRIPRVSDTFNVTN